jgi:hypothetical protein
LAKEVQQFADSIEAAIPDRNACLVLNPLVMRAWLDGDVFPTEPLSSLVLRFPRVLMHAVTLDGFAGDLLAAVSGGKLQSVLPIVDARLPYEISSNSKDICGPFSGLSFGPINTSNDHVFAIGTDDSTVRTLISIGGLPSMVAVWRDKSEILFLAGEDIVDVDAEVGSEPMCNYFSRLLPHAMALRHIFGEECWHPCTSHASIIIDDPILRRDYGYLNFESLLRLTQRHNFHATISFIPHNYKRNSERIIRMFRENTDRLSICFHGNDHTQAELASTDSALLNTALGTAEERMAVHEQATGLHCDRVMVFPQDDYSVEAMEVLKFRNFFAASSSPSPVGQHESLRIADLAQPAVLRYGGIPLFIRSFIRHTRSEDIAFNLFFGRPILIGEHHDAFKQPESLLEAVQNINSIAPEIIWSNLESVAENSILKRRTSDGTVQVQSYSNNVLIANDSVSVERFSIEWGHSGQLAPTELVMRDGTRFSDVEFVQSGIRVRVELPPGASQRFSLVYRNALPTVGKPGFIWDIKVFLRRRLSELRDNYLSKNQHVLTAAKVLQRRFLQ